MKRHRTKSARGRCDRKSRVTPWRFLSFSRQRPDALLYPAIRRPVSALPVGDATLFPATSVSGNWLNAKQVTAVPKLSPPLVRKDTQNRPLLSLLAGARWADNLPVAAEQSSPAGVACVSRRLRPAIRSRRCRQAARACRHGRHLVAASWLAARRGVIAPHATRRRGTLRLCSLATNRSSHRSRQPVEWHTRRSDRRRHGSPRGRHRAALAVVKERRSDWRRRGDTASRGDAASPAQASPAQAKPPLLSVVKVPFEPTTPRPQVRPRSQAGVLHAKRPESERRAATPLKQTTSPVAYASSAKSNPVAPPSDARTVSAGSRRRRCARQRRRLLRWTAPFSPAHHVMKHRRRHPTPRRRPHQRSPRRLRRCRQLRQRTNDSSPPPCEGLPSPTNGWTPMPLPRYGLRLIGAC